MAKGEKVGDARNFLGQENGQPAGFCDKFGVFCAGEVLAAGEGIAFVVDGDADDGFHADIVQAGMRGCEEACAALAWDARGVRR